MTTTPTGWRELTRTRYVTGQAMFDFVDGPARGEQPLDVGDERIPPGYAVVGHAGNDEEAVYIRKGSIGRWYFEYARPVLNLSEHITCPRCGRTSAHPKHIEEGWCAACRSYTQLGAHELHSGTETVENPWGESNPEVTALQAERSTRNEPGTRIDETAGRAGRPA